MTQIEKFVLPAGLTGAMFLKARAAVPRVGIASGDWVIIREQPTVDAGDVAALMADGDVILSDGVPGDGAHVIGVVAGVLSQERG